MSRSIAATVFLEIVKPREVRVSAIFRGVVLIHFVPVMGSPAASYFISSSISMITCGVFFYRLPASTRPAYMLQVQILSKQLFPPLGHGVHIHSQKIGDFSVAAVTQPQGLQATAQTPLLLIQATVDQYRCRCE